MPAAACSGRAWDWEFRSANSAANCICIAWVVPGQWDTPSLHVHVCCHLTKKKQLTSGGQKQIFQSYWDSEFHSGIETAPRFLITSYARKQCWKNEARTMMLFSIDHLFQRHSENAAGTYVQLKHQERSLLLTPHIDLRRRLHDRRNKNMTLSHGIAGKFNDDKIPVEQTSVGINLAVVDQSVTGESSMPC